ncbi:MULTISPECIES: hypothetical protein [Bacillaceae]|uniref:Uncharacterized protein n=1 Tax=Evansella alkalicola TaxID=745819 RepID=A0ABS6K102_9BACI|nr:MULTISPECIES: hypothetical protein [Bacillaceae]MBU9724117.1 hypothetical protein [Bacillus alkalicola]
MADLNTNLLRTLDGPASQHKKSGQDEMEFSEGSDNAIHTKVTDPNTGQPIDPRQVTDNQVKTVLDSIKQQQSQIIDRINDPLLTEDSKVKGELEEIDTKLTTLISIIESGLNVGTGNSIVEMWSGSSNETRNFNQNLNTFGITNDGNTNVNITIGDVSFSVKQGESFEASFNSFDEIVIDTTSPYRAYVKGGAE